MSDEILSTWQEIASYLKITIEATKRMSREHPDFPVWKQGRMWTTKGALIQFFERKAISRGKG